MFRFVCQETTSISHIANKVINLRYRSALAPALNSYTLNLYLILILLRSCNLYLAARSSEPLLSRWTTPTHFPYLTIGRGTGRLHRPRGNERIKVAGKVPYLEIHVPASNNIAATTAEHKSTRRTSRENRPVETRHKRRNKCEFGSPKKTNSY